MPDIKMEESSFKVYYHKLYQQSSEVKFPLFQLPFQKNKLFTGREDQLKQISEYLTTQNTLAITSSTTSQAQMVVGLGGVGKTQLVIEYAYQAQAKNLYQIVWFLNGHNLDADYLALAAQLNVYGDSKEEVIEQTKNKLQKLGNYLLVIDDAVNYESVKDYLPMTGNNGHILITTRHKSHWQQMLELGVFDIDEALAYFKQLINYAEAEQDRVIYLVNILLGRLPLALTQAGAFINRTGITIEKYIEYFEAQLKILWGEEKKPEDYADTIAVTWNITLNKIKETHPQAEDLLGGISFLAPAPSIIEENWLSGVVENEPDRREGLDELAIYSMLNQQTNGYTVHQLVQEVVFASSSAKDKPNYLLKIYEKLKTIYPYGPNKEQLEDHAEKRNLLPHLEKYLSCVEKCLIEFKQNKTSEDFQINLVATIENELEFWVLILIANGYDNLGDVSKNKVFLKRALKILETHYDSDHPHVAIILANLGNAYSILGNAKKQKMLFEHALQIQESHYGSDHPEVAQILMNLGNAYNSLGDRLKAKELFECALKIQENHYDSDHPEVAQTLMNLGNTYCALRDALKARELLERALKIKETHYGFDHPEVALTLVNLSNAYGILRDALKQKVLLERALQIQEIHYGSDCHQVVQTLMNLGSAYSALDDALKAKELFERALKIKETHYGSDHPEVALTLANLSNAYGALGDAIKKKELLVRALKIEESYYGFDHLEVSFTLGNLGNVYVVLGDALKANELLERALKIKEAHYGFNHPEVALALANLSNACSDLGSQLRAKELLERALKIQETYYGSDHSEVAVILINLGVTYEALGNALKAKELFERALKIQETYYGSDHPEVALILTNLGIAYGNLGDVIKKKEFLERALKIEEICYGSDHPKAALTLLNLAITHQQLSNLKKAMKLMQRAYRIFYLYPSFGPQHPDTQKAKAWIDKHEGLSATNIVELPTMSFFEHSDDLSVKSSDVVNKNVKTKLERTEEEQIELQQAIALSLRELSRSDIVLPHASTAFFQPSSSSSFINEWQKQIQANAEEVEQVSTRQIELSEDDEFDFYDSEEANSVLTDMDEENLSDADLSQSPPRPS